MKNMEQEIKQEFKEEIEYNEEIDHHCDCCEHICFEDLTLEEQKMLFVNYYMMINGVMPLSKMLDILKSAHNLEISNKEIIEIINDNEDITISDDIIFYEGFDEAKDFILKLKEQQQDYYIIEDVANFLEDYDSTLDSLENTLSNYDIDSEVAGIIQSTIIMGSLDEKILKSILQEFDINLTSKNLNKLSNEINTLSKNFRLWILNGYRPIDIKKQK